VKNPIIYGGAVTGEDFADREDELREIIRDLENCERIFLISPRRYGKTSLIFETQRELAEYLKMTSIPYTRWLKKGSSLL